jgi:hypothetical protein
MACRLVCWLGILIKNQPSPRRDKAVDDSRCAFPFFHFLLIKLKKAEIGLNDDVSMERYLQPGCAYRTRAYKKRIGAFVCGFVVVDG